MKEAAIIHKDPVKEAVISPPQKKKQEEPYASAEDKVKETLMLKKIWTHVK